MKEKFTEDEWKILKILPLIAPVLVAGIDGKIDEMEKAEMDKQLKEAVWLKDPLHKELLIDLGRSDLDFVLEDAMSVPRSEFISKVKGILKSKLTTDEYQRFIGSMFISGIKVAKASGGGFLGLGDKMSKDEAKALALFAALFDLDPKSIEKHFG